MGKIGTEQTHSRCVASRNPTHFFGSCVCGRFPVNPAKMSSMAHHWEARFRQRQVDKMQAAKLRMAEKEAEEERVRCEVAARQALEQQEEQDARSAALQKQIQTRDKSGIKKSYKEREQQLQRLLQEQKWHNEMIRKMEKEERRSLRTDALRDHNSKFKVLRDHGLYRGDASFFLDPEYA